MKHFKFNGQTKVNLNIILHQIVATQDLPQHGVHKGDIGGWIEKEDNLSDGAWVSDNARVFGNAQVCGNAWVSGNAQVYGNARVSGNAQVYGNAWVFGNAWVYGNARVYGHALFCNNERITTGLHSSNAVINSKPQGIVSPIDLEVALKNGFEITGLEAWFLTTHESSITATKKLCSCATFDVINFGCKCGGA